MSLSSLLSDPYMAGLIKGTLGGGASFQGMEAGLFRQVRFCRGQECRTGPWIQ